jgi:hypothetical protein
VPQKNAPIIEMLDLRMGTEVRVRFDENTVPLVCDLTRAEEAMPPGAKRSNHDG